MKYFRSITEATDRKSKAGTLQALLLLLLRLTRIVILTFVIDTNDTNTNTSANSFAKTTKNHNIFSSGGDVSGVHLLR